MKNLYMLRKNCNKAVVKAILEDNIKTFLDKRLKCYEEVNPRLVDDYWVTVIVEGTEQHKQRLRRQNKKLFKALRR